MNRTLKLIFSGCIPKVQRELIKYFNFLDYGCNPIHHVPHGLSIPFWKYGKKLENMSVETTRDPID